jgi:hypothetical protein
MDCEINLSRFKDIADNIIRIEDNYVDKNLKLYYKSDPARRIVSIMKYLNCTDFKNLKFNEYGIQKNNENYIIILNYVAPRTFFSK